MRRAHLRAALGDDEHPHAPVVLRRAALDEPLRLEAVDEAGHVGAVAVQLTRELAHRHRALRVQRAQREHLRRRQPELARDAEHPRAHLPEEPADERPGLLDGGLRGMLRPAKSLSYTIVD